MTTQTIHGKGMRELQRLRALANEHFRNSRRLAVLLVQTENELRRLRKDSGQ